MGGPVLKQSSVYAVAIALALCGLAVQWLTLAPFEGALFMFQFAAVVGAALYGGWGPGLLATALSAVGHVALFFGATISRAEASRLVAFLVVSVPFAGLAAKLRRTVAAEQTARLRAEEATREAERIGRFQERLVAIVSHDLRNPLGAISMGVRRLQDLPLDPRHARTVTRLAGTAARMEGLVRDLLDFARDRHGGGFPVYPRPVDLAEVCARALDELRLAHPEREITATTEGDGAAVADPARVAQVVSNLVSNALKHGAAARPVHVGVRGLERQVELTVRNEGPPIPPELMSELFEPFRAGDAEGSVGLGLFIVAEIAHAHGGSASVTSDERETVFKVDLPRAQASPAPAREA